MNKNILTAAIGAALIVGPLAAQADVKISGRVGGALTSFGGDVGAIGLSMNDFGHSRIQVDGTSGNFFARVADDVRGTKLTKGFGEREMYLGYKMGDIKITFGRMQNAGKNIEKDPYIATFLEYRSSVLGLASSLNSNGFNDGMIGASGKAGDISWTVNYNPNSTTATGVNPVGVAGQTEVAIKGKFGGVNAFLSYVSAETIKIDFGTGATTFSGGSTVMKIGASMKFGDITGKLFMVNWDLAGTSYSTYILGANMGLGDGLSADFAYGSGDLEGAPSNATWMRLAVMKKMGKSNVYAGYSTQDFGSGTSHNRFGVGATVKF